MTYESILQGLNPAQRAAVTSPATVVQILAPPGSGKTKTLTSRVSYLLQHYGYQPWDTLCLTFTIKSAKEMKERIEKLIGNGLGSKLILGTFHSVCRRYLVAYGHLIGLRKGFGIADTSDSMAIIKSITKRLNSSLDSKAVRSRISKLKAQVDGFADLRQKASTGKQSSVEQQDFIIIYEDYESQLETSNLLDYDDLLLRCLELLRLHPECVSNVQAVLVDEFQDTNTVQFELMQLFASKNNRITTVGDPDQSIYGWRSADITNLEKMQKRYPDTLVINLEENYRSSGAIILAALEVIQQDESRPAKSISPTHCPGTVPVFRKLPTASCEASWIVSEISRCVTLTRKELFNLSDFAILLRTAALSRQIESAMGKAGMAYRMVGGLRFYDRVEVKIVLDYLRVISQPENSEALSRIINVPSRRIGETTVRSLRDEARSKKLPLFELIRKSAQGNVKLVTKLNSPAEKGLAGLFDVLLSTRKKLLCDKSPLSPCELLQYVLQRLGFEQYLKRTYEDDHESRWANVEELVAQASDFEVNQSASEQDDTDALPELESVPQARNSNAEEALNKFLANVALSTELQRDDEMDNEGGAPQERVTISTIHAAKGLEWPVVFIPAVYNGTIPHSRAEDCDEERRLLYVAMTRAQALLYMSSPKKNSNGDKTEACPFLEPREVSRHLVNKGPSLRQSTISDIARILGRKCPTDETLRIGRDSALNVEDDLWRVDGEEGVEDKASRWNWEASLQSSSKRRRLNEEYGGTSMLETSTKFTEDYTGSITYAAHTSGFISARQHLPSTDSFRQKENIRYDSQDESKHNKSKKPSKVLGNTQSTLSTFFGVPRTGKASSTPLDFSRAGPRIPEPKSSTTTFPIGGEQVSFARIAHTTTTSTSTTATAAAAAAALFGTETPAKVNVNRVAVPLALPTSTCVPAPRPVSNATSSRPKVQLEDGHTLSHPLLSSSPPRPAAVNTTYTYTHTAAAAAAQQSKATTEQVTGDRPATTFHCTTVQSLQSLQKQSHAVPQRKTLGVRRSLVGWSARGGGGAGGAAGGIHRPRPT